MRLRFVKMNPAGNTTILVLDPVPVPAQAEVALDLMDPTVIGAEQVGFVTFCASWEVAASLRMMGGEFCGNAARALGAYLAYRNDRKLTREGRVVRGLIRVSGAEEPVAVEAKLDQNGMPCWAGCVFPGPFRVIFYRTQGQDPGSGAQYEPYSDVEQLSTTWLGVGAGAGGACRDDRSTVAVVHLPGITHIVVDADECAPAGDVLFRLRSAFGLEAEPCVGVMFCRGQEDVVPLVHVTATDTLVWESSCASGCVAVALARSIASRRPGRYTSRQPRGTLHATINFLGDPERGGGIVAHLEGEVRMVAEGEVFLERASAGDTTRSQA